MKKTPSKQRISALAAIALLAIAAVVGVVALLTRDGDADRDRGPSASATSAVTAPNGGTATPSAGATLDPADQLVIPKTLVNPLRGKNYCETAKLLAIYTRQGYGLTEELGLQSESRQFDERLKLIAATFARLADQAAAKPKAGDVAAHWQLLGERTTKLEQTFRLVGFRTKAQAMIVEMAKWKELAQNELPAATGTLKEACGFSKAVFGL